MYALTTPEWKLILEEGVPDRLFDRRVDPHELVNLANEDPRTADSAREELLAAMREQTQRGGRFGAEGPAGELDPLLLKELQELGYMGGTPDE
jgi:arylsulfatase A-like enzyme